MKAISRGLRYCACFVALLAAPACNREEALPYENALRVFINPMGLDDVRTHAVVYLPGKAPAEVKEEDTVWPGAVFPVRTKAGPIHVQFVLVKGVADTIGFAEQTFTIVEGYTYYAGIHRKRVGIISGCVFCSGAVKFPFRGSAAGTTDSLQLDFSYGFPLCKGCQASRSAREVLVALRQ